MNRVDFYLEQAVAQNNFIAMLEQEILDYDFNEIFTESVGSSVKNYLKKMTEELNLDLFFGYDLSRISGSIDGSD